MKITYSWLKEHLETTATATEMADTLIKQGLCVDDLTVPGVHLAPFKTVEIVAIAPHPDADRLQICQVNTGTETLQIVCGAPNARKGLIGVLAQIGDTIPLNGMKIKASQIRGIESQGMLCSENELGIVAEGDGMASGIIDLPQDTALGQSIGQVLGLDDPIFDIDVTPNRGDCLGAYGLARELAAGGIGRLKSLSYTPPKVMTTHSFALNLDFRDPTPADMTAPPCPFFAGRVLTNLKNCPSPSWLQRQLKAVGITPHSAIVDVTNYIAYDLGRPLHSFDSAALHPPLTITRGQNIAFSALDDKTYKLTDQDIVINDQERTIALAGIMGGAASAVTEKTTEIFLEAAIFDPIAIAKTGQRLDLTSDARQRFERGVDPQLVIPGLERATALILEICGGEASEIRTIGKLPGAHPNLNFPFSLLQTLGGITLPQTESMQILDSLGFTLKYHNEMASITPPSWRHDVTSAPDIVEEILRIKGYAAIPETPLPPISPAQRHHDPVQAQKKSLALQVRRGLISQGFDEVIGFSFTSATDAQTFGAGYAVQNPISEELSQMRVSLLPHLLKSAKKAMNRGISHGAIFEVGNVFAAPSPDASPQDHHTHVSALIFGSPPRHWGGQSALDSDFFTLKGVLVRLFQTLKIPTDKLTWSPATLPWLHPGKSATVSLGPKIILAEMGVLHPLTAAAYQLKGPVVVMQIPLSAIPPLKSPGTTAPLQSSLFPPLNRDFAFVVDGEMPSGHLLQAALKAAAHYHPTGHIFDVYTGENVPTGKKSVALTLTLSQPDKTFEESEIEAISQTIQQAVIKKTGGVLRT